MQAQAQHVGVEDRIVKRRDVVDPRRRPKLFLVRGLLDHRGGVVPEVGAQLHLGACGERRAKFFRWQRNQKVVERSERKGGLLRRRQLLH